MLQFNEKILIKAPLKIKFEELNMSFIYIYLNCDLNI